MTNLKRLFEETDGLSVQPLGLYGARHGNISGAVARVDRERGFIPANCAIDAASAGFFVAGFHQSD
jgi:hypothetical protein